jgi:rhodanese-related sulfurtransferase
MNKTFKRLSFSVTIGCCLFYPETAHAVIPPDFMFNIGTQVAQFFSIVLIFFTAVSGTLFGFLKATFFTIKRKKTILFVTLFSVVLISLLLSYLYADFRQKAEYEKWKLESKNFSDSKSDDANAVIGSASGYDNKNEDEVKNTASGSSEMSGHANITDIDRGKLEITNQEFKHVIESGAGNFVVLDARENIEYENGNFPGSIHIRSADLKDGRWAYLPKDKMVYVVCWSGIRGKEVAEFLRKKNIAASYLENGANGWVEFGGKWDGGIGLSEKYSDEKYTIVLSTKEVKKLMKKGVVLVDTREPEKFNKWHIPGSINIPILYTSTNNIDMVFGQVAKGSSVITVCDGYINCFDAKITGIELEKRGNQFLGRYNKPWEYEQ